MTLYRHTPCKHGLVKNHDYGPPHDPIECLGGSRSTVSGFSPEAVQAAALAILVIEYGQRTVDDDPEWVYDAAYDPDGFAYEWAAAALAAAWAHDFGNPT